MNKSEISNELNATHFSFWDSAKQLPNPTISKNGKWSVAQNVEHIHLTLSQISKLLSLPKIDIENRFGTTKKASVNYDEFVKSYQNALTNGVQSPAAFVPEYNLDTNLEELIAHGITILKTFQTNLQNWSEEELEQLLCIHPALGKISVKEMLFFAIFHVKYHQQIINR